MIIKKVYSIALLLLLSGCSILSGNEEPRTLLCGYHTASLVLTCENGMEECEAVCANLQENLRLIDYMKLQMIRQQQQLEQSLRSQPHGRTI